ncbi:MAG: helix-turn-helix domain-containing protein [Hydrogenophaga sp.]|nr:helix-turn-helix domain-containing protein [Hydrogenophaga sp.]
MLAELAGQHLCTAHAAESAREACLGHIAHLLPLGTVSIDLVAQRMGTLQRRLSEEGVAFSVLVQSLREQLLHAHLASPRHNLTAVSGLLGFSSPSAFSRWHRATFGESARARGAATGRQAGPSSTSPQL